MAERNHLFKKTKIQIKMILHVKKTVFYPFLLLLTYKIAFNGRGK